MTVQEIKVYCRVYDISISKMYGNKGQEKGKEKLLPGRRGGMLYESRL